MLLVCTVKLGKSIGRDRGKKASTLKGKDPLSCAIWIPKLFRDILGVKGVSVIKNYGRLQ